MATAFTPGPWVVGTDEHGDVVIDRINDENRICTVGRNAMGDKAAVSNLGHFDTPEVRADANLIASAPDLFAALEWVRANYAAGSTAEINFRIDDALRKARGESA
jgi:hypothetical protein